MAALNAFDRDILIYLPGVPQPVVEWAVLLAARSFCGDSTAIRRDSALTTVAGITRYELDVDEDGAEVALIVEAKLDGRKLTPGTDYVYDENAGEFVFAQDPGAAALTLTIAVQPKPDAAVVPDQLLDYQTVIAAGARAKLAAMPGQTWSNPDVVKAANVEFKVGVNAALVAANKSNVRTSLRVQPRKFA